MFVESVFVSRVFQDRGSEQRSGDEIISRRKESLVSGQQAGQPQSDSSLLLSFSVQDCVDCVDCV